MIYKFNSGVRVHLPLQQGLRLITFFMDDGAFGVRVHLPLQQGLRHRGFCNYGSLVVWVRVHLPLQQGLRQLVL